MQKSTTCFRPLSTSELPPYRNEQMCVHVNGHLQQLTRLATPGSCTQRVGGGVGRLLGGGQPRAWPSWGAGTRRRLNLGLGIEEEPPNRRPTQTSQAGRLGVRARAECMLTSARDRSWEN